MEYRINLHLLDTKLTEIKKDKKNFDTGREKIDNITFSDSDSVLKGIIKPIKQSCDTIDKGYQLLIDWLDDYIEAVKVTERKAEDKINNIDGLHLNFGSFSNQSSNASSSYIGGIGTIGSIFDGSSGTNSNPTNPDQNPITSPYDKEFEKIKVEQNTKPLEEQIKNKTDEINKIKSETEKEKAEEELKKLQYELETLMIINSLQSLLVEFNSFDEYKEYVNKLKTEVETLQKIINSDKYLSIELIDLLIDKNYDPSKPIYSYIDENGIMGFTLDKAIINDENAKNVKTLSFDDLIKEYGENEYFKKYKELYIDNKNIADQKEKFVSQLTVNKEKIPSQTYELINLLIDKNYDSTKPIYSYTDENGIVRFTLDEAINNNASAKDVKKVSFDDLYKEFGQNEYFQKYKEIYIDNTKSVAIEKENFAKEISKLDKEKKEFIITNHYIAKYREYENHQRIIDYVNEKAEQTVNN